MERNKKPFWEVVLDVAAMAITIASLLILTKIFIYIKTVLETVN